MKKLLLLVVLFAAAPLCPNVLLQAPQKTSQLDLEKLEAEWTTVFNWIFTRYLTLTCGYENGASYWALKFYNLPVKSFDYYKQDLCHEGEEYDYFIGRPIKLSNREPQNLELSSLCELLDNKKFIFYTGAGLSAASDVPTMAGLEAVLGFSLSDPLALLRELNDTDSRLAEGFTRFCKQAIYAAPTEAHYALHTIAQKKQVGIITENVDILQERVGSVPIFSHSKAMYEIVQSNDLQVIDVIVCVGLSHDDCGLLGLYKQINPQGIIVALDLSVPDYLSDEDYLLQGDLQKALPYLAEYFVNSSRR